MSFAAKVWPVYNYVYPRSIRADSITCITTITPRCTRIPARCQHKCNCLKARVTIDPSELRREHQAGRSKALLLILNLMTGFTALADRIQSLLSFPTSPKWPSGQEVLLASLCMAHNLQSSSRNFVLYCFLETLLVVFEELGALWRTSPQASSWSTGYPHGSYSCRPSPCWSWWW